MIPQILLTRRVLSCTLTRPLSGVACVSIRKMDRCGVKHKCMVLQQRRSLSLDALTNSFHVFPQAFLWVHQHTGMPWWSVIVLGAVTVRCVGVFPFMPMVQRTSARRELCMTSLQFDKNEVKRRVVQTSMKEKWPSEKFAAELMRQMSERSWNLFRKEQCQMWRLLLPVPAQISFWIAASMGLRDIINHPTASIQHALLVDEGMLWFPDLTQPDGGLAMLFCLAILANIELSPFSFHLAQQGRLSSQPAPTGFSKHMLTALRCAAVGGFLVAQILPSGLVLYWSVSSLTALGTQVAMRHSGVRRLLRVPPTPTESTNLVGDFKTYFNSLMKTFRENQVNYAREQRAKQAAKRTAREAELNEKVAKESGRT